MISGGGGMFSSMSEVMTKISITQDMVSDLGQKGAPYAKRRTPIYIHYENYKEQKRFWTLTLPRPHTHTHTHNHTNKVAKLGQLRSISWMDTPGFTLSFKVSSVLSFDGVVSRRDREQRGK